MKAFLIRVIRFDPFGYEAACQQATPEHPAPDSPFCEQDEIIHGSCIEEAIVRVFLASNCGVDWCASYPYIWKEVSPEEEDWGMLEGCWITEKQLQFAREHLDIPPPTENFPEIT